MGRLFGTDGIRGLANEYPVTPDMARRVGRVVADFFGQPGRKAKILLGKDTRISGHMLEEALVSGIRSAGGDALLAGVLPTPGVAFVTRHLELDGGIMVSASHNPFHDNGIKIIQHDGFKLSDETELEMERKILDDHTTPESEPPESAGTALTISHAQNDYVQFLEQAVFDGETLQGLHLVLDCANGATFQAAPAALQALGAKVKTLFADPDGSNINLNCGSEYPHEVARQVVDLKADAGFAFDGDGDRVIAVDETGQILRGDQMLAICARALKDEKRLRNDLVVSTVMSNMGLTLALKALGIDHVMTQVGDRYVVQEMRARGGFLGGEDSGHMIFLEKHTTGDGILTALWLLRAMKRSGKPLSMLRKIMKVYPQRLLNIEVSNKPPIETVPEIVEAIEQTEKTLGNQGRVLVRYSGTQPMCRVMVEAPTPAQSERLCREIAGVVKKILA